MHYALLIIIQIGLLYWLSGQVNKQIMRLFYRNLNSSTKVAWALNLLYWPGVLVHELSHLVVGRLLLVRTHGLSIVPKNMPDGMVQMGSVQVPKTDRLRMLLIGVAPVFIGLAAIFGLLWIAEWQNLWDYWVWWLIIGYSLFQISNNMFLSSSDVRGALVLIIICIAIVSLLYWLGWRPELTWIEPWLNGQQSMLAQAFRWLWVPISIDLLVLLLLRILVRY